MPSAFGIDGDQSGTIGAISESETRRAVTFLVSGSRSFKSFSVHAEHLCEKNTNRG